MKMPKTKLQGVVFGLLMSITMAYGMEVYNVALKEGGLAQMTNHVFLNALLEAAYMWIFVFLFSNLWGNRIGHFLAGKICWEGNAPFINTVLISGCTVLIMCPTMSLVAAILFSILMGGEQWQTTGPSATTASISYGTIVEPVCCRPSFASALPPNLCPTDHRAKVPI